MEYYSAIKKNKAMFFAAVKKAQNNAICYLDSTRDDHRKSIRKRKTNTMWYHLLFVEPKIWHKVTYLWNRNRIRDTEHKLVVVKGEGLDGGMEWESGISRCKLAYTGWMNNKVLWHSTGNYIQIPVINHNRKENMKKDVCIYIYPYVCITESLCHTAVINKYFSVTLKKEIHTLFFFPFLIFPLIMINKNFNKKEMKKRRLAHTVDLILTVVIHIKETEFCQD